MTRLTFALTLIIIFVTAAFLFAATINRADCDCVVTIDARSTPRLALETPSAIEWYLETVE